MAALSLFAVACNDSEYDLQKLVPEEYHSVVNVQDDSNLSLRIYDTGLAKTFQFTALRGGSDPSIAIEAEAVPMTQQELSEVGADYVLLPSSYYSLDGGISIPANEGYGKFSVSFTADQIAEVRELNSSLDEGKIYCLALKIVSKSTTVFQDKSFVVRRLDVVLPELGFAEAGQMPKKLYDAKQTVMFDFAVMRGETDMTQAVKASLVAMSDERLAQIDPSYMQVPAESYAIDHRMIEIAAGEEQLPLTVSFTGDQISDIRELAASCAKTPVLGLEIVSEDAAVVDGKSTLIFVLDITQPILHLELASGAAPHTYWPYWWDNQAYGTWYRPYTDFKTPTADCWGNKVTFRLRMPDGIDNTWTINCKLSYDPSLIAAYNDIEERMGDGLYGGMENWKKRKTYYDELPSADDMLFFDEAGNRIDEITLLPGQNEATFSYGKNPEIGGFNGAGLYLCPVVVTTDLFPVDKAQYVLFEDEITLGDKTLWEPFDAGEGVLTDIYDGNRWGNKWQTSWYPGYCDTKYGQYFQINIPQYQPSHAIHIAVWGNGDNEWHWNESTTPREMRVFITSDAVPAPSGDRAADRTMYDALSWVEVGHVWCQAHSGQCWISPKIDLNGQKANAIRICTYSKAGDSASYKRQDNLGDFNVSPYNSEVQSVLNETTFWSGWEDTYGNNIVITEFKMWGN